MMTYLMPVDVRDVGAILPETLRSLFWEAPMAPASPWSSTTDTRLEKEAWLNRVTLEWGPCGQNLLAVEPERTLGTILYAPPRMVPGSRLLPSGPVSRDAILLTTLQVAPGMECTGYEFTLIEGAVADLSRRGVKAIEAFGCTGEHPQEPPTEGAAPTSESIVHGPQELIPASTLLESGFDIVTPHPVHPRFRLELGGNLNWSAAVEYALDQLQVTEFHRLDESRYSPTFSSASNSANK